MMDYTPSQSRLLVKFAKAETGLSEAMAVVEKLRSEHSELQRKVLDEFGTNYLHEMVNVRRYMEAFPEVFK